MEHSRPPRYNHMLPFLVCGIVFVGLGFGQPVFLGIGMAMLGLATAIGLGGRREGRP